MGRAIPAASFQWKTVILGLVLLTDLRIVRAEQSNAGLSKDRPLTAEQQQRLQERDRLWTEAKQHQADGKLAEAVTAAEKMLAIDRALSGNAHAEVAYSLEYLAGLHEAREDFAGARKARQEVVAINTELWGAKHWKVRDARLALAHVERLVRLEPAQRQLLRDAKHLNQEVENLGGQGKYDQALPLAVKALEIRKQVLGEEHPDYTTSLNNLGWIYRDQGDYAQAEPLLRAALEIRKQVLGENHPWYALSLTNLAILYKLRRDYTKAEPLYRLALEVRRQALGDKHPNYAASLNNLAEVYVSMGVYAQAEPLFRQAAEIRKQVLGDKHPAYATSLDNLGALYWSMADYARAEPLFRQAMEIKRQALGDKHPAYATSLDNLAALYSSMGDYANAGPLSRQAVEIYKQALGDKHPDYAISLNNLALLYKLTGDCDQAEALYRQVLTIYQQVRGDRHPDYATSLDNLGSLYHSKGDYAQAEPLYWQALQIRKQALGDKHPAYAASLNNLAILYKSMRDYAKAEPLFRQALQIRKQALGDKHPDYAISLVNLAELYRSMGSYTQAEPLYRQALDICKQTLGDKHPHYATCLNNLALLYQSMGEYVRAEPLSRQIMKIYKEALGDKHPHYATCLNNLAFLYQSMGDHAQAEALYRQALKIYQQVWGDHHPEYATSLDNLGTLYGSRGEPERGWPLCRQAVQIMHQHLDLTARAQSERQQLVMTERLRYFLDNSLSFFARIKDAGEAVYPEVLAWKGATSARQQAMRRMHRARRGNVPPEVLRISTDLDKATRALATLSRATPDPRKLEERRSTLEHLSQEIERLEQALARSSATFRQQLARRQRTTEDIRQALPAGGVLIDLLEYDHFSPPSEGKGKGSWHLRLAAFVVRKDQPVQRVDLGPVEPIAAAVNAWRQTYGSGKIGQDNSPGTELRRLVWEPLAGLVKDASIVLLSPDGDLARFPWAALPGKEPGAYLLEERAVAVVPIPQLVPELLGTREPIPAQPSLLLVGEVNFDAAPGVAADAAANRSAPRGEGAAGALQWSPLPGTRAEVVAIKDSFQRRYGRKAVLTELREEEPTEEEVRRQISKHQYLHFATHGFFAPPQMHSALAAASQTRGSPTTGPFSVQEVSGFHPGLLSGLVLAGANQPVRPDQDDGILTALEVAELDLGGVELATLSACETGLGKSAGGEGLLGLQRAFQIAGARSVMATLWQVRDDAARSLMVDFYENLWKKKMSKLEALRAAQLAMLRDGIKRGMEIAGQPADPKRRLPPYYWAAFVLSGDWR
jgi:CHAT domain-containing protein/Tfp pilus assembly protein PilF